jgi:hypothetical protein
MRGLRSHSHNGVVGSNPNDACMYLYACFVLPCTVRGLLTCRIAVQGPTRRLSTNLETRKALGSTGLYKPPVGGVVTRDFD